MIWTQEEYDALGRDKSGYKVLDSGDWRQVNFGEDNDGLRFESNCLIGDYRTFGDQCIIGNNCVIGERATFGEDCELGKNCRVGGGARFARRCAAGAETVFLGSVQAAEHFQADARCRITGNSRFGPFSAFGERVRFSGPCKFERECSFEDYAVTDGLILYAGGLNRMTELTGFCDRHTGRIYVRHDHYFGPLEEYEKIMHGYTGLDLHVRKEEQMLDALAFCEYLKTVFRRYRKD